MKNRFIKLTTIFLVFLLAFAMIELPSYATDYLNPESITPSDGGNVATNARTIAGHVLSIVQVIGVSVAIIMLIVLAIKYMSAAPNDKAEIKKHAVVYVVGAVLLFGGSVVLGIIQSFAGQIH